MLADERFDLWLPLLPDLFLLLHHLPLLRFGKFRIGIVLLNGFQQEACGVFDLVALPAALEQMDFLVDILGKGGFRVLAQVLRPHLLVHIAETLLPYLQRILRRYADVLQFLDHQRHILQFRKQLFLFGFCFGKQGHTPDFEFERGHFAALALLVHDHPEIRHLVDLGNGRIEDFILEPLEGRVSAVRDPHELAEEFQRDVPCFSIIAARAQGIRAEFPQRQAVFAVEAPLQVEIETGIHRRIMQTAAQFGAVSIGEHTPLAAGLRQQRRGPPLRSRVLIQDIPFHNATHHGL